MADAASPAPLDYEEQLARIRRMNVETQKFVEEGMKLAAEARKLHAEELKIGRDRFLAPVSIAFAGMAAGAAIFGAATAFVKLLGP